MIAMNAVITMYSAASEVCLGRERNKPQVKLKCFLRCHFAELPLNYLEIFSTVKVPSFKNGIHMKMWVVIVKKLKSERMKTFYIALRYSSS